MTDTEAAVGPAPAEVAPQAVGGTSPADALLAERDFLLRSIADLESEYGAGELDPQQFKALHDQYTVQAATVIQAIGRLELEPAAAPLAPKRRGRRALVTAALALALVAAAGSLLFGALGDRQPGQTITGNAQSAAGLDALARAARQSPDDYDAQLDYATALMQAGRASDALRAFDAAARLDPTAPEPKAYGGWLVFLAGLPDRALPRLDAAIAADPDYPDARFFRGMVLLRGRNDRAGALIEFRRFLELTPAGAERDTVQRLVDELESPATATTGGPPQ